MSERDTIEAIREINDELYDLVSANYRSLTPNGMAHILAYQLVSIVIHNIEDGIDSRELVQEIVANIHDDIRKKMEEETKEGEKDED